VRLISVEFSEPFGDGTFFKRARLPAPALHDPHLQHEDTDKAFNAVADAFERSL
jgi:hypothetical protein